MSRPNTQRYGPSFAQCFIISSLHLGVILRSDQPLAGFEHDPPFSKTGIRNSPDKVSEHVFFPGSCVFPHCAEVHQIESMEATETAHENRGEP
jgi:hypothetical protein